MASSDEEILLVERAAGGVGVLTLHRPASKNALDTALVEQLGKELEQVAVDPGVRVLVLTGAGGAFCSGADLKAAMANAEDMLAQVEQHLERYHRLIRAIVAMPQPVIAMVDGPAVGFGCDLALACDLRVLSTRAYLQEKFVRIGLIPDGGGTFWLARLIGLGRALEIVLTGDRVPAERAYELGLANRLVAVEQLREETMALARQLAAGPPRAMAEIKRAVRDSLSDGLEAALAREKRVQLERLHSADFSEGVAAWLQQRPPEFTGK